MLTNLFTSRNLRIFLISFGLVFAMVFLQKIVPHLQLVHKAPLASPVTTHDQTMQSLQGLLQQKADSFRLSSAPQLVTTAYAGADYDNASAYVVIDYDTGKILAERNGQKQLQIASLTKIMSAVVALDLTQPSELMTVSQDAPHMPPTRLALTPGEKFSVEELLNAGLLTSANDCMQVLMEGVNNKYHDQVFVDAMNDKANSLGLKNSHFTNPQGFDDGLPYSSAEDLARLSHYALTHYPLIAQIAQKDHEVLTASPLHTESWLNNWNGLIGVYPGAFGLKIGNTDAAGYTTVVASERDEKRVLVVLLGAPEVLERDQWAAQLLDLGFERLAGLPPVNVTDAQLHAKYQTWKYFN